MMERTTILKIAGAILIAASALSCAKTPQTKGSDPVFMDGNRLVFSVSANGFSTRSHFEDGAPDAEGTTAKLVWDDTDTIGVIAVPYDREKGDYRFDLAADNAHVSLAAFVRSDGSGNALFASIEENVTWWASEGYTDDDCLYGLFAYYPANGKHPFKVYAENLNIEDYRIESVYAPSFNLPCEQDGKSFNRYQILTDKTHFPTLDIDESDLFSVATLKNAGTSENALSFTNFRPLTTLLRFRIKKTENCPYSQIDAIRITIKAQEEDNAWFEIYQDGFYRGSVEQYYFGYFMPYFGISGQGVNALAFSNGLQNVLLDLTREEVPEKEEEYKDMMNTSLISINPDSEVAYVLGSLNVKGLSTNNFVSATFAEPVQVTTEPSSDWYYLVTYPTFLNFLATMDDEEDRQRVVENVVFEAFSEGHSVMYDEKAIPVKELKAGHRYNFTITLGEGVSFDTDNAGSYEVTPIELN